MKRIAHCKEDLRLTQTMGIVTRHMKLAIDKRIAKAHHNLEFHHWIILKYLDNHNGSPQRDIANFGQKDKTSITRIINTMEKMNLVVRKADENDKRNRLIYLTTKGKEVSMNVTPIIHQFIDDVETGIEKDELKLAEKVLMKIYNNIKNTMVEQLDNQYKSEEYDV